MIQVSHLQHLSNSCSVLHSAVQAEDQSDVLIECCYCNLTSYLPGPEVDEDGDRTIGGMEGPGGEVGMVEIVVLGPVAIVIYKHKPKSYISHRYDLFITV